MSSIHVLIDGIVFENDFQIGIWRVFYETMRRTSKDIQYTLLLSRKPRQPVPEGVQVQQSSHRGKWRRFNLLERLRRKQSIRRLLANRFRDAIWHSTFFSIDPRHAQRSVVTVYDMVAERYFHLGPDWAAAQHERQSAAILRANQILAISNSTAADISKFFPDSCGKITVMPLGSEHIERVHLEADLSSPNPYSLFIGNRDYYKNYVVVVEALASARWPNGMSLKVVGAPFSEMEKSLHNFFNVADKIEHVGHVSDAELSRLYQKAICFLFPSLAEGFGLPLLERK